MTVLHSAAAAPAVYSSPPIAVYKENGQYSVKASCARGHCLLYSVLTCWYKFQGFNPGCGSRVVAGGGGAVGFSDTGACEI